jgi:TRAP-type C4-dicarboxylate transport system permease small subunit
MDTARRRGAFFDAVLDIGGGAAALVILFTMLAVIYEVVMRYFLNRPTSWVLEVVEWCQVWMTFLSAAWVLKEKSHVTIDIVAARLKPRARAILEVVTSSVGALVCLTMAWFGGQVVWDHFARRGVEATLLQAPKGPLLLVIPLGFFLMFLQFLRRIISLLRGRG